MTILDTLIADYAVTKKKFMDEAQELFKEAVKDIFTKVPGLTAIRWNQYTPYFNDGEPCEFRVNEPYFTNVKDLDRLSSYGELNDEKEGDAEVSFSSPYNIDWKTKVKTSNLPESMKGCEEILENFRIAFNKSEMEEVLLGMFGDHQVVTATPDSIETEEYQHD